MTVKIHAHFQTDAANRIADVLTLYGSAVSRRSTRFHPAVADGACAASTCYARKRVPRFPEVDSLRLARHVSCYRLRLITKRGSARAALRRWLRDDEVWNHETSATWSSRPSLLSFSTSFSLAHPALIIDDAIPAARFLPSPSTRFSSRYSLMNGRFSILFLPLSLHAILPRNRPGDRSRLPALASPGARSRKLVRLLFLLREDPRDPRRPRDYPHHAARPSRSVHVDHRQGSAGASSAGCSHLSPCTYDTFVMVARILLLRWRRDEIIRNVHRLHYRPRVNH